MNKSLSYKVKFVENVKDTQTLPKYKINFAIEILLFLLFLFFSGCLLIIHFYQPDFSKGQISSLYTLKQIYVYSIGLAFGDLIIFIIIGIFATFLIRWIAHSLNYKSLRWFRKYWKVDNWIFKKKAIIFIWLNLLIIAYFYHFVLVSLRFDNFAYFTVQNVKNVFTKGWYYSFTNNAINNSTLPNSNLNIGIFADSILNCIYALSFSPYLAFILIAILTIYTYSSFILVDIKIYFKYLNPKKFSLEQIKYNLKKSFIFYYSEDIDNYFNFVTKSAFAQKENLDLSLDNLLKKLVFYKKALKLTIINIYEIKNQENKLLASYKVNEKIDYKTSYEKEYLVWVDNLNSSLFNQENYKRIVFKDDRTLLENYQEQIKNQDKNILYELLIYYANKENLEDRILIDKYGYYLKNNFSCDLLYGAVNTYIFKETNSFLEMKKQLDKDITLNKRDEKLETISLNNENLYYEYEEKLESKIIQKEVKNLTLDNQPYIHLDTQEIKLDEKIDPNSNYNMSINKIDKEEKEIEKNEFNFSEFDSPILED
ncbi:hypothetical protein ACLRE7_00290 [Mycoplasmopsis meleagridis]|uniref:hypothetical protein n=1 Tax=Mycoplasmopsis meleagridis TaxID=29561 RepID=UPI003A87ACA8